MEAGSRGEHRLVQKLSELRFAGSWKVFSNVSLSIGEWKVQIDCLVVTDRCFIVLESKNFSDDLFVDEKTEEFYKVTSDGNEVSLPNPYFQLMKHIRFIKEYFKNDFPHAQVTGSVVMTSKSCRIRQKPANYPFCKLEGMNEKVIHIYNHFNSHQISTSQLQKIEHKIQTEQTPFTYPPLCEHYRISLNQLKTGIECPNCGVLGMKRVYSTWTCPACKTNDRYAHISAVNDYFLLIKREITSKEFRRFCEVESSYTASRLLNKMDLEAHGSRPSRYFTPKKSH